MAETRKLELMAKDGRAFIVTASTEAGSTVYDDYALRWGNKTIRLSEEDMRELVEFVGYPHETTERADAAEAHAITLEVAAQALNVALGAREAELSRIRVEVGTLVEALKGAWWLDAASSYHQLADWAKR